MDKLYRGRPAVAVTAVPVPGDRFTLEGHDLVMVDVGHGDADDNSVLHVPDLALVVAGDVIYNGVHIYLAQSAAAGLGAWRDAIGQVEALGPGYIVTRHRNRTRRRREADDRPDREYLEDAEELLRPRTTRSATSTPRSTGTRTTWADDLVGDRPRALRHPRASRRKPRQDHPRLWL